MGWGRGGVAAEETGGMGKRRGGLRHLRARGTRRPRGCSRQCRLLHLCILHPERRLLHPCVLLPSGRSWTLEQPWAQTPEMCVVGVARTPMGSFLGGLSSLPATKLGSVAIEAALRRANVDPSLVQEVFFGNVLSANLGQVPARQAALGAGIPNTVVCTTVNKVCASGMKATMFAAQSIQLGINDIVVAGGMESMSNAPKYIAEARKGSRFGHDSLVDGMLKDGLWDVYGDCAMGVCAELCADNHALTREAQIVCATCNFQDTTLNNDIILCDGACDRGFHQNCLNPPLLTKDSCTIFEVVDRGCTISAGYCFFVLPFELFDFDQPHSLQGTLGVEYNLPSGKWFL